MKNQKGITLITLVITIVVMIIIAGVATYSGIESLGSAKATAFIQELEMIQAKVNVIYEKRKTNSEEKEYYDKLGQDITVINEETLSQVLGESSKEGFRYFSKKDLSSIDLDDIKQNVIINYDTCEVVSITGIEIDGVKYYKLKDLPNYNWYNVEHVNKNTEAKDFIVEQTKLSDSYRITIKDTNGNDINTGSLSYKLHNSENWLLNGNNMSFIVNEPGIYDIKYTDTAGNNKIDQFVINGELISDEDGNKIPVPNGFIHTEGTKNTGFVIKDVSIDSEDNPTITNGNEYVWIPCTVDGKNQTIKYDRYAFSENDWIYTQTKGEYDNETNSYKIIREDKNTYYYTEAMPYIGIKTELESINIYGGFYIGRYEVGITDYTALETNNVNNDEKWTGYTGGIGVVQKSKEVWNWITRDKAKEIAENMYSSSDRIISRLCSSYAWDTTLKFLNIENIGYITNSIQGNYSGTIGKTGETIPINNLYDIGGNVWEWTTEDNNNDSLAYTNRGGRFL